MNEFRQVIGDLSKFIEEYVHAYNIMYPALLDIKSNLDFYANGYGEEDERDCVATTFPAPAECCEAEHRNAERGVCDESAPQNDKEERAQAVKEQRSIVYAVAKPEHRLFHSAKSLPLPDVNVARMALNHEDEIPVVTYYDRFTEACAKAGCAYITQKGMRYLAYCAGYEKVKAVGPGRRTCLVRKR